MSVNPLYHHTPERLEEELVWIQRAKGNPEFFGPLYKKYHEPIFRYVHQRMDDTEMAFDVTSQVFMKALKNLHKYEYRGAPFGSWLYRIATNESLTFLENQKKRSAVSLSDVESGLSNKIKADQNFDANKLEWKLQLAIQQLPEKQKLVFNLRYYDEMPYEEMSRVLETSEGALKASYHHAVKKIEEFILNH